MERLFENTLVMILAGGKGERLYPLTRDRSKPSVPFLGSYRIIDFSLSNCLNSGLRKIALLTQYKSLSLERHILYGWNIFHPDSRGYIISLPAQGRMGDRWYEGTADAVFQNIYSIQKVNPEAILILSGDHVYKMDYRKMFRFFNKKKADFVIMAKPVEHRETKRFGVLKVNDEKRITNFVEKPDKLLPIPSNSQNSLISMGVYIFRTRILIKALIKDAKNSKSTYDFGKDLIPRMIHENRGYAYFFKGYWEDIGTIDAYWKANMSFLSSSPPFRVNDNSWPIRSYKGQFASSFIQNGNITNSIISSGCLISGGIIRDAIVSPGVKIRKNSNVQNSIIFQEVEIGKRAKLKNVIVDKYSLIPDGFEIGYDGELDKKNFNVTDEGIRIVPKNWRPE